MKKLFLLLSIFSILVACSPTKRTTDINKFIDSHSATETRNFIDSIYYSESNIFAQFRIRYKVENFGDTLIINQTRLQIRVIRETDSIFIRH